MQRQEKKEKWNTLKATDRWRKKSRRRQRLKEKKLWICLDKSRKLFIKSSNEEVNGIGTFFFVRRGCCSSLFCLSSEITFFFDNNSFAVLSSVERTSQRKFERFNIWYVAHNNRINVNSMEEQRCAEPRRDVVLFYLFDIKAITHT